MRTSPKRLTLPFLSLPLLLLAAGGAGAEPAAGGPVARDPVEVRKIERRAFAGEAEKLHADLSFGGLTVEGADGRDVEVEVTIQCSRQDLEKCRLRAERIRLRPRMKKGTLVVKLKNTPRGRMQGLKARMLLRVPRRLALDINVRGGGVWVGGMESDVEIDSLAGDVDLTHRRDLVAAVKVDVGVGDADLWLADSRVKGHGFPRTLRWYGSGAAQINVDVGTGDVAVRLE